MKQELTRLVEFVSLNRRRILLVSGGILALLFFVAILELVAMYSHYAGVVESRLADRSLFYPSGIFAAPRRISTGESINPEGLAERLLRGGYRQADQPDEFAIGTFGILGDRVEILTNEFAGSAQLPSRITVRFNDKSVIAIENAETREKINHIDLPAEMLTADVDAKVQTRRATSFDDLPPRLISALTAIEDRRFFTHYGVDPKGLIRAFAVNLAAGHIRQGGSTITQQLIKNQFLTPERTYSRKLAEAMMAIALERRLTKQQIFALYCERIYLGHSGQTSIYGFKQAARVYFGKDLRDLSLNEIASLAGAARAPNRCSLHTGLNEALERRDLVLRAMTSTKAISVTEAESARSEQLAVLPPQKLDAGSAPHFVDFVNRELDRNQLNARALSLNDGDWPQMRVETTLDLDLQEAANQAISKHLASLGKTLAKRKLASRPEAALVALDPHTGAILAMVGGSSYATSQLNRVTDAMRQPGSVFKPIVYAAALSRGFSPASTFINAPREIVFGDHAIYRPQNYGHTYSQRPVTLREAMVRSLNVVAVDAAMQVGLGNVAEMARRVGLNIPQIYPSMALGAVEASPLEIARAYTTFANFGTRVEPQAIRSVKAGGESLLNTAPTTSSVLPPSLAFLVQDAMEDVVDRGTAARVRKLGYRGPAAGKTGTSRDAWFVGYTPNLLVVVWVGYDDNTELKMTGGDAAVPIWTDFIVRAHQLRTDLTTKGFAKPGGVEQVEIDADNGLIATEFCPHKQKMYTSTSTTPGICSQHTEPQLAVQMVDIGSELEMPSFEEETPAVPFVPRQEP